MQIEGQEGKKTSNSSTERVRGSPISLFVLGLPTMPFSRLYLSVHPLLTTWLMLASTCVRVNACLCG